MIPLNSYAVASPSNFWRLGVFGLVAFAGGCPVGNGVDASETVIPCDSTEQWYLDADGDGYGDAASVHAGCDAPAGYVLDASDCDDAVATSYPGAVDACDGVDNDCDGEDEHCSLDPWDSIDGVLLGEPGDGLGVVMQPTSTGGVWLLASDFRSAETGTGRIYRWEGAVVGEQEVAVGAALVLTDRFSTGDKEVNDVWPWGEDGLVIGTSGGAVALLSADDVPVAAFFDSGGVGLDRPWAVGDVAGDGVADDVLFSGGEGELTQGQLVASVFYGTRRGDLHLREEDARIEPQFGDAPVVSFWADFARDVDGDGIDEFAAYGANPNAVFLFLGPVAGAMTLADADITVAAGYWTAKRVPAGDVDGDGRNDLILDYHNHRDTDWAKVRSTFVYAFAADTGDGRATLAQVAELEREDLDSSLGGPLGGGDFQGDGVGDLVLASSLGGVENSLWIVSGPISGMIVEEEKDSRLLLEDRIHKLAVIDLDADGLAELLLADNDNFSATDGEASRIDVISGTSLSLLIP